MVYGGIFGDSTRPALPPDQAAGKLVVVRVAPQADGTPAGTVGRAVVTERYRTAAGIAVATLDAIGATDREGLRATGAQLTGGKAPEQPAFMYVTTRMAEALLQAGTVRGSIAFADTPPEAAARNVVAILPGSDPALRGQYVAIGAHNDHVGIAPDAAGPRLAPRVQPRHAPARRRRHRRASRRPSRRRRSARCSTACGRCSRPRRDSIFNGADDDGSGSVSVLEIAEALAKSPDRPKRSILFVWHTGEELGLLGSDCFTHHPTVPRDSIVAQLNIDMIGRGGAGGHRRAAAPATCSSSARAGSRPSWATWSSG